MTTPESKATIKSILHLASFKKWSCKGNCQHPAKWIHAKVSERPRTGPITFSGRCDKHKSEEDFRIEELRDLVHETPPGDGDNGDQA